MKSPNLDYRRMSDHLVDRGLVDRDTVHHVLHQCQSTGALLSEVLVGEGFVSDWELSRVCSELFHLPYLPLEAYEPSEDAREGLDPDFLRQYAMVPLDRFGKLVTVSLPGIVPMEVLDGLVEGTGLKVVPVVGSVTSNRRWINEHMPLAGGGGMASDLGALGATLGEDDDSWTSMFDSADEAVNLDLTSPGSDDGFDLDLSLGDDEAAA